ncbi:trypsin-like serine protease [Nocardiopsis sp. CNT-189]|uniref:trypsin-like serine peptidase n=1 Tax=Nocardiopsis oceanisediminis TaxID=2816862 RepID=UPI003B30D160
MHKTVSFAGTTILALGVLASPAQAIETPAEMDMKDPQSQPVSLNGKISIPDSFSLSSGGGHYAIEDPGKGAPDSPEDHGASPYTGNNDSDENGDIGTPEIIGGDNRYRVETDFHPYTAVTLIEYDDGGWCTGWLAGPDVVVTAGHCVSEGGTGKFFAPETTTVIPAYDNRWDPAAPFGECGVTNLAPQKAWLYDAPPHSP